MPIKSNIYDSQFATQAILLIVVSCHTGIILSRVSCEPHYSVSIITDPSHGPFKVDQTVYFTCLISPTPPDEDSITYQWRPIEYAFGGFSPESSQTIRRWSGHYTDTLRYCMYFCDVFINEVLAGSASKLIERSGKAHEYNY